MVTSTSPPPWSKIQATTFLTAGAAITRLVGAVLLEQDEHWQLEGRRMFSAESMSAIPSLEELPVQPSLQEAAA